MDAIRPESAGCIRRIATRLGGQAGFALPITLFMLMAAFALVSVGVIATIDAQRGTSRDESTKSSLQLAQTGVNDALLHFNRISPSPTNQCSPVSGTAPDANGWCQQITTTDPAGGTYSYQVRVCDSAGVCPTPSGHATAIVEIVGVGAINNTTRRVDVQANSASGTQPFSTYQVKSADGITLDSNAMIHAGTATNGDLTLNSNAKQCGLASVGVGHEMRTAGANSYFSDPNCTTAASDYSHQQLNLPPVNQGSAATINDDGRLFSQDLVSGSKANACWNGLKANGTTGLCGPRQLDIGGSTSVTLTGSLYSFCKLTMSVNTSLFSSSGHPVVIYFDSPESCGYPSGTAQLSMASNTRISSNDGSPVQLLFVGSQTLQTSILLSSNTDTDAACVQNFIVYAPLTAIEMNSNSTYCGALAGKSLHLDSHADVRTDAVSAGFIIPNAAPHYAANRFVECSATTPSPPNSGC
jgi:Tfp pilus assembly protein PilX